MSSANLEIVLAILSSLVALAVIGTPIIMLFAYPIALLIKKDQLRIKQGLEVYWIVSAVIALVMIWFSTQWDNTNSATQRLTAILYGAYGTSLALSLFQMYRQHKQLAQLGR